VGVGGSWGGGGLLTVEVCRDEGGANGKNRPP